MEDQSSNPPGHGGRPTTFTSNGLQDLRCYSASYASAGAPPPPRAKLKKGRSTGSAGSRAWCLSDPELQRKKRVASYKVYSVEGKMKGSFRKSFRWVKERYSEIVHGWR